MTLIITGVARPNIPSPPSLERLGEYDDDSQGETEGAVTIDRSVDTEPSLLFTQISGIVDEARDPAMLTHGIRFYGPQYALRAYAPQDTEFIGAKSHQFVLYEGMGIRMRTHETAAGNTYEMYAVLPINGQTGVRIDLASPAGEAAGVVYKGEEADWLVRLLAPKILAEILSEPHRGDQRTEIVTHITSMLWELGGVVPRTERSPSNYRNPSALWRILSR